MAAVRRADATWNGDLVSGKGKVSASSSGVFKGLDVSWARRSEADANGVTSPVELLAAAHAACFCMGLSHELGEASTPPDRLEADVTVEFVPGERVKSSRITVTGRVPGIDQETFMKAAVSAGQNCPISGALKGNVELVVDASLAS